MVDRHALRIDDQIRIAGDVVFAVDSRKVADLSVSCLLIQSFRIPFLAFRKRAFHVNFDMIARLEHLFDHQAVFLVRRDESRQNKKAGIHEQLRNLPDSAYVFFPVIARKSEVPIEAMPDIVPIQDIRGDISSMKLLLQSERERRFSRAGQARKPESTAIVADSPLTVLPRNYGMLP